MKAVVLGCPRPLHQNRWKDDLAEAAMELGWDVTHLETRGIPTGEVVRACKGADVLIWGRTHGHDPRGDISAMLRRVEEAGTVTVGVHLDLYWGIGRREAQVGVHPWWTCQHVFTADGGNQARFEVRGVNHHWMPPPMGRRFLGRVKRTGRFRRGDVVFVGGFVRDIHGPHRSQLLAWAGRRWPGRFAHYGFGRRKLWGRALGDLYASARVVLGDSAPARFYWSDRVPCTLGRGGLLAHPTTAGLPEQGYTGDHLLTYRRFDFAGLGDRIDALTDTRRKEMTDAALALIEERHLWVHRLRDIEKVITDAGDHRVCGASAQMGQPFGGAVASGTG